MICAETLLPPKDPPYSDYDHRRMDVQAIQYLASLREAFGDQAEFLRSPAAVLRAVIETDNRLDPRRSLHSFQMFHAHPELEPMLVEAWKAKSFRDIRGIEYLQAPSLRSQLIPAAQLKALRKGLTTPYKGQAVDAFHDYLDKVMSQSDAFGRVCSVVQSSGTGKTRLLLELAKQDVYVLYMNIRSPDDKLGFPPRDNVPADILTYPGDDEEYRKRCCAFFEAVFEVLCKFMQTDLNWYDDMCTFGSLVRGLFFMDLQKEFVNKFQKSGDLRVLPGGHPARVRKVVIVLDDAHIFQKDELFFGRESILFNVIKSYSRARWGKACVVLASTSPEVEHLSGNEDPSASPVRGRTFFQPFTQLGWDQHAPTPERVQADQVAKMKHILQYGRPLWSSLKKGFSPEQILELACEKLCGEREFVPDHDQTLAVFGQRFGLDLEDASFAKTGVMDHLRVCTKMTEDWSWCETTYPPEPIVSCAAASLLHKGNHLDRSLCELEQLVEDGIIDAKLEALLGRLLWLLAKDLFVRQPNVSEIMYAHAHSEPELLDCQPVSVVEFLTFVFGPRIWEMAPQAREAFRNAYVNFSHWATKRQSSEEEYVDWSALWQRTSAVQFEGDASVIDKVIPVYFKPEQTGDHAGMSYILISGGRQTVAHGNFAPGSDLPYIAVAVDLSECAPTLEVVDISEREMKMGISASGCDPAVFTFLDGPGQVVAQRLKELYKLQDSLKDRGSQDEEDST